MEGIDPFADEVGVLRGEFGGIETGNDADESRVTLDVVAPMIFAQAEAEDVIKLCFSAGQLDVSHHMGLRLLVEQPIITMALNVFQLCPEGLTIYMFCRQPTMLEPREHHIIAIFNLLDFHIVYCLVGYLRSLTSFYHRCQRHFI